MCQFCLRHDAFLLTTTTFAFVLLILKITFEWSQENVLNFFLSKIYLIIHEKFHPYLNKISKFHQKTFKMHLSLQYSRFSITSLQALQKEIIILIRYRLDYEAFIHNLAIKSVLTPLDTLNTI